jgi:cytochrome d ubiquinol oxidase subunit I
MRYGIEIPKLLSILAFHDPDARVRGLNAFPPERRPNANVVHLSFDLMIGSFFIMFAAMLWFWIARWRRSKDVPASRLLLIAILAASPFGLIAQESGWFVTEFGRQPWIARDVMLVSAGVTPRSGIEWVLITFLLVYVALTAGLLKLLLAPSPLRPGVPEQKEDYR